MAQRQQPAGSGGGLVAKRPSGPRLRSATPGLLEALATDSSSEDGDGLPDAAEAMSGSGSGSWSAAAAGSGVAEGRAALGGESRSSRYGMDLFPMASLQRGASHHGKSSAGSMHNSRGNSSIVTHFSVAATVARQGKALTTAAAARAGPHSSAASSPVVMGEPHTPLASHALSRRTAGPYGARRGHPADGASGGRETLSESAASKSKMGLPDGPPGAELTELSHTDESPTGAPHPPRPSGLTSSDFLNCEERSLNSSGSIRGLEPTGLPHRSRPTAAFVTSSGDCADVDCSRDTTESIPSLEMSEVHLLRTCFHRADTNKSGYLDVKQFGLLCNMLMKESASSSGDVDASSTHVLPDDKFDPHTVDFVFRVLDTSRSGQLSLRDYVAGSAILCHANLRQRLLYLFRFADTENREALTEEDLLELVNAVFTVVVTPPGHKWGMPTSPPPEGRWPRQFYASGVLSLDYNPETLMERAQRYFGRDGRMTLPAFKAWAMDEPAFCAWLTRLGSRGNKAVRRVRVARERKLFVSEMAQLGFSEEELSLGKFASVDAAPDIYSLAEDTPSAAGGSGDLETMGGPLRQSRSTTFGPGGAVSDGSGPASVTAGFHSSARQSSFEIDFSTLELERRIGEGTFAEVWAGRWLEAPVAIKVFKSRTSAVAMYQLRKGQNAPIVEGANQLNHSLSGSEGLAPGASSDQLSQRLLTTTSQAENDGLWDTTAAPPEANVSGPSVPGASQHSDTSDQSASFLREVELLSNLRHPNVLLYMGACVKATAPLCIVSEHVQGGSLHDNLHGASSKTRLISSPSDRLLISLDIARGMLYLHSQVPVLLHRDLKSSNILVDSSAGRGGGASRVKAVLCDFGLSRLDNSPTQRAGATDGTSLVGTLISMAPEIILQERYTSRADVFSFGIILWELWTGQVPHAGLMPVQLMFQVAVKGARPPIAPGSMPPTIARLIRQCWATDASTRPVFLEVVRKLQQFGRQEMGLTL